MNNSVQSVRHRDMTTGRAEDRRVRRTTDALVDALIHLVVEKGYDAVTVQDLLDHADIGRSTFYAHYRGKDDLLTKSFERLLAMLDHSLDRDRPPSLRVAPVRELFRHVREFGHFRRAVERDGMLHRTYKAGVDHMTSSIARRLEVLGW